jgi:hypothetical protein
VTFSDIFRHFRRCRREVTFQTLANTFPDTKYTALGVIPYLTRITQIRDELAAVGEKTEDPELVRIALDGFTKSWDVFVRGVVTREKLPDWQLVVG